MVLAMRETRTDELPTSLCTVVGMNALQGKASSGCLGLGRVLRSWQGVWVSLMTGFLAAHVSRLVTLVLCVGSCVIKNHLSDTTLNPILRKGHQSPQRFPHGLGERIGAGC